MTTIESRALPLARNQVDTDVIAPQSELLVVDRAGLADAAFRAWRRNPDGTPTDSVLNDSRYQGAEILLSGDSFGCGSSREHAVWALQGCGFRAVLATSFGEIFERNAARNGLAPVVVSRPALDHLVEAVRQRPDSRVSIDLDAGVVRVGDFSCEASLSTESHRFLVEGYDEIQQTLMILDGRQGMPGEGEPPTAPPDGRWERETLGLLSSWHEQSMVRTSPHLLVQEEIKDGRVLFPRHLMPYLDHPLVAELPVARQEELVARRLYDYLSFVVNLEAKVVNRGTCIVAFDELDLGVPEQLKRDSWKIYCDEAYHALTGIDLLAQVVRGSRITPIPYDFGPVLGALGAAGRDVGDALPGLDHLLEVIVFETVVTELLTDIPVDTAVVPTIRQMVAEHATDERIHHAYFSIFFDWLWSKLDRGQREMAARALPGMVVACLAPDVSSVRRSLAAAGLSPEAAAQVIEESYPQDRTQLGVRRAARKTVRMFLAHDVLDLSGAEDAFDAAGLLDAGKR
jgi:3-isopropylmalate dehydratase small subunit